MRRTKYQYILSETDRKKLHDIVSKGKAPARTIRNANILLAGDCKNGIKSVKEISDAYNTTDVTVYHIIDRYKQDGLKTLLQRKKRETPPIPPKITGEVEAEIFRIACSKPPKGSDGWTLSLIADKVVRSGVVDSISRSSVHNILKKNEMKPHLNEYWCIPPDQNAAFVANMEDVLDVYARPYDERVAVICLDEKPLQLLGETREHFIKENGTLCQDYEYVRKGTCSIFLATEPLKGWRHAIAKERRTKVDFAHYMQWIIDGPYSDKDKIILVCDNLNTHVQAAFYEAFEPATARRLLNKLEFHYTPKHGSWLNIAETELSVLTRQCLGKRRIPDIETLNEELKAWHTRRNMTQIGVDWHFTTADARVKLKRLYPIIQVA